MSGLREAFDEIVADVPVYGDLDRAIERADRERRRRHGALAGLAAAVAVVVAIVSMLAASRDGNDPPDPVVPVPTPTTPLTPPSPTTPRGASGPAAPWSPATWGGAVRDDQASLPVIRLDEGRMDGPDTGIAGVDIRRVTASRRPAWSLELEEPPPLAWTLVPGMTAMEQGVVVDGDGDRVADCRIAISTDAPSPGDMRVWVTDLRTDVTSEQVGPMYGRPFDFSHPATSEDRRDADGYAARTVVLFFVGGEGAYCAPFGGSAAFYTYAVLLEGGRPTAVDFAPDDAWLEMP